MDDITAWADAEIHELDAEGWREAERCASRFGEGMPADWGDPCYRGSVEKATALLAARDRVLAGLTTKSRTVLLDIAANNGDWRPDGQTVRSYEVLQRRGLVLGIPVHLRPLGHEIARCIKEPSDG